MSSIAKVRKICVVVFSRANYARIKTLLRAINEHPDLELNLVLGASALLWRYGNITDVVARDGFKVSRTVHSIVEGGTPGTMAKSTGLSIIELATTFENLNPDIVLTIADRFETMATALTASYMNIPVAHTQGGEVTGSIDESVRHSITKLSHIHFPSTEKAYDRLLKMGENPEYVFLTGCPAMDTLIEADLSMPSNIFEQFGIGHDRLNPYEPFLLVLQHPVTTEYGDGLFQINQTLEAVERMDMPAVWIWPNADAGTDHIAKGLRVFKENHPESKKIEFFLNFTPEDYARLLANTACIIGNSSSGIREGAFLGTPAVNIGTRQNSRERSLNVIDVSNNSKEIEAAIKKQLAHGRYESDYLYGKGNAGKKIADILSKVNCNHQKVLHY